MTTAHVLEMPRKLSYSIELYTAVNSSMYLYFAIFGAIAVSEPGESTTTCRPQFAAWSAAGGVAWRACVEDVGLASGVERQFPPGFRPLMIGTCQTEYSLGSRIAAIA
jgi:hypothetical protein